MRLLALLLLLAPGAALAQAQTVFGSTNASRCYQESKLPLTDYGLRYCSDALREDGLLLRDRAATLTNRGIIYSANGQFQEALADHEEALLLAPDMGEIYVNRGNVRHQLNDYEGAVSDFDSAIALDDVAIDIAHYNKALSLIRLKRWAEAKESLELSLSVNPDFQRAQRKLAEFEVPADTSR